MGLTNESNTLEKSLGGRRGGRAVFDVRKAILALALHMSTRREKKILKLLTSFHVHLATPCSELIISSNSTAGGTLAILASQCEILGG